MPDYIAELPDDLKPIARRVPKWARAKMGPRELRLRCEYVIDLLGEKRDQEVGKVLEAVPLAVFVSMVKVLNVAIDTATAQGQDPQPLLAQLDKLVKDNPQPVFERASNGEDITDVLEEVMGAGRRRRWWQFWKVKNA